MALMLKGGDRESGKATASGSWDSSSVYKALVAQSCPILSDQVDCCPPGSCLRGISQAKILEWVVISFSRGSSQARNWTQVSTIVCEPRSPPLSADALLSEPPGKLQENVDLHSTPSRRWILPQPKWAGNRLSFTTSRREHSLPTFCF